MITRTIAANQLLSYLKHQTTLEALVNWAEEAMMQAEFEKEHAKEIREAVSRIGLADVKHFGLLWDDCEELLNLLGYHTQIAINRVA